MNRLSLNGTWQLDRTTSESIEELLELMGIGYFKRRIIASLDITDQYIINATTYHLIRDTSHSHKNETYLLNIEQNVNDDILGYIKQTINYYSDERSDIVNSNTRGALIIHILHPSNAKAYSYRRLLPTNLNRMIYISNFTVPDGSITKSCIRYFNRK
jgi:hypothetical protein